MSVSNVERALCGLSYACAHDHEDQVFYWSMYGVEALYGTGPSGGILEKLKERIPLLIPGYEISMIKRIYGFRSSIVHGGRNLYMEMYQDNDSDDDIILRGDVVEELVATLVSSLQGLVKMGKHNLGFEVQLN